jgi:hypothetical protein
MAEVLLFHHAHEAELFLYAGGQHLFADDSLTRH